MRIRHNEVMVVNGRLTQVGLSFRAGKNWKRYAVFSCQCGSKKILFVNAVVRGESTSCGCYRKDQSSIRNSTHGKHGTITYSSWKKMLARSRGTSGDQSQQYYQHVLCCERWLSFENFLEDMGERPSLDYSIDRKDNSKGYSAENCRWATRVEQGRNKRNNVNLTLNNRTQCLSAWAEEIGVNMRAIRHRLNRGWSVEDALTIPVRETIRK